MAVFAACLLAAAPTSQESVSFPTADGGRVFADVYGDGDHGVVLAHGGVFNKESWQRQARALAAAGLRVVAIDFRGRGQSRGGPDSGGTGLRFDVLAAVGHLRETGAQTVSVVGASMGGGAAAQASIAAAPGEIDRLVLLAHAPVDEPERIKGRKLFIVSQGDSGIASVRRQHDLAREPKELVVLDGSAHAQFIFETEQGERLMEELLRFLTAGSLLFKAPTTDNYAR
jgi:pimeloyl-ACP methyl ester carboxylesterase